MTAPTPLLPCPFCGGGAELIALEPNEAFVECKTCRAAHPTFFGKENTAAQAIATWNRRDYHPTPHPVAPGSEEWTLNFWKNLALMLKDELLETRQKKQQLEEDADVAETKFQQQSMILEQQAAEIERLRAQLAVAQQPQPTYFGMTFEQYAIDIRNKYYALINEHALAKEELAHLQGKYGLPNYSLADIRKELDRRSAAQPKQEDDDA